MSSNVGCRVTTRLRLEPIGHNRRSRAVMERLGMSYRGEIRWPGLVEGRDGIVDDAPFALYVLARTPTR